MDANDEKINTVEQYGQKLLGQNHYASDKIFRKTESLKERYVKVVIRPAEGGQGGKCIGTWRSVGDPVWVRIRWWPVEGITC